jgi:hypothetical protein
VKNFTFGPQPVLRIGVTPLCLEELVGMILNRSRGAAPGTSVFETPCSTMPPLVIIMMSKPHVRTVHSL